MLIMGEKEDTWVGVDFAVDVVELKPTKKRFPSGPLVTDGHGRVKSVLYGYELKDGEWWFEFADGPDLVSLNEDASVAELAKAAVCKTVGR